MKLLSLTSLNSTNYGLVQQTKNHCTYSGDTVSFQARAKAVVKSVPQKKSPDILKVVKNMLSNDKTGKLFTKIAQVFLGAAVVTEFLTTGEDSETKKLLRQELKKAGIDVENELQTNKTKPGRTPKYNQEELKAKMQELAEKGMTQTQIAKELGLSPSYTAVLMRNADIKTQRAKTYGQGPKDLVEKYINQNPERKAYTDYLQKYPKLLKAYLDMIKENIKKPNNKKHQETLKLTEQIFESLYKEDEEIQKINSKYFEALENKYADDMDIVCEGLRIHLNNDAGVYSFLANLMNDTTTKQDLEKYIKLKLLNFGEFLDLNGVVDINAMKSMQFIKEKGNIESFSVEKVGKDKSFIYRVQFKEGCSVRDKLNDIVLINESLHGPLAMFSNTELEPIEKLKEELIKISHHTEDLNFCYNILRFIEPEETYAYKESHNLPTRLDLLLPKDKEFKGLKRYVVSRFKALDPQNANFQTLYKVLNNNEIYPDILQNNHAKLRFVGRFVLNQKCGPEKLEGKTKKYATIFQNELNTRLETGCKILPYQGNRNGIAPCLFLGKNQFGSYIKITINKDGLIQTLFQDLPENIMNQSRNQSFAPSQQ